MPVCLSVCLSSSSPILKTQTSNNLNPLMPPVSTDTTTPPHATRRSTYINLKKIKEPPPRPPIYTYTYHIPLPASPFIWLGLTLFPWLSPSSRFLWFFFIPICSPFSPSLFAILYCHFSTSSHLLPTFFPLLQTAPTLLQTTPSATFPLDACLSLFPNKLKRPTKFT